MENFEEKLEELFLKLPAMPPNGKETAVKVIPWIIIVFGVFGVLAWFTSLRFVFGFGGMMGQMPGYVYPDIFMMIYIIIAPIIQIMSIWGAYLMLSRKRKGWRLVLYSLLIGVIANFLSGSIFGILIVCIFAYILFQIKEYFSES